jgi:hypothetical protein
VTPDYRAIFEALDEHVVVFIVIGAVALLLHGSARVTRDLAVCYSRERAKRTAGRLKDLADLAEIQEIRRLGRSR